MFCSRFFWRLDIFWLLFHNHWCCTLKGFSKLFAGRFTSSEKSCVLYAFKKFVQKFCWYQIRSLSMWSQESYKLSQLAGPISLWRKISKAFVVKFTSPSLLGESKFISFCFLCLGEVAESKISLCYPQEFGRFSSVFSRAGWSNLVRVECLQMIKPVEVSFCFTGGWCYSGWWVWDLKTLSQIQGSEMLPALFQDIMNGYLKF